MLLAFITSVIVFSAIFEISNELFAPNTSTYPGSKTLELKMLDKCNSTLEPLRCNSVPTKKGVIPHHLLDEVSSCNEQYKIHCFFTVFCVFEPLYKLTVCTRKPLHNKNIPEGVIRTPGNTNVQYLFGSINLSNLSNLCVVKFASINYGALSHYQGPPH